MNIHSPRHPWLYTLSEYQRKRPYSVISTMLYLCNAIGTEYDFKDKLYNLFQKYSDVPIHKIGFIDSWELNPLWKRN